MENPKCPYCGGEMEFQQGWVFPFYKCVDCGSTSPMRNTPEEARAAAMKRENKYREQVEFDVKEAINLLNRNSRQMPYYIYSILYDQISAIGYTPTKCGAKMRKEANDER